MRAEINFFSFLHGLRVFVVEVFFLGVFLTVTPSSAQTHFLDLSKAANRGFSESFDQASPEVKDLEQKEGFGAIPPGIQVFRGVPFHIIDPAQNGGRSFIALKGRSKPDFPEAVSIPAGGMKAADLYFLHTCRWGGTAPNIKVAEYDVVYGDGQVAVIPLRVGVELTNFFGSDDTASSFLAWWHKYKNVDMGLNFYAWKNPNPEKSIQTILFKSLSKMPVPLLFAVTASDKELAVSPDSPKPEKTFQTDTSKWIPFQPLAASTAGTALDMSFLLDAPAGKHGKVKAEGDRLVFEDGTPAKFWGVFIRSFSNAKPEKDFNLSLSKNIIDSSLIDQLALSGCNAVLTEEEPDKDLFEALKKRGIYVCVRKPAVETEVPRAATPDSESMEDPAFIDGNLLSWGNEAWNPVDRGLSPTGFSDVPMVTAPESSLPLRLSRGRALGKPFGAQWEADWPNEFLGEIPLLLSASAALEEWNASFGLKSGDWEKGPLGPINLPQIWAQWPTASLAFLRGDLKEGKIYVIKRDDSAAGDMESELNCLAHQSGLNPEGGKWSTDVGGKLKAKIQPKLKTFISDTGQISWQGNVGVVQVASSRFQALIGFLAHRKFNNPYWAVETPNPFASLSVISLSNKALNVSDHLLLTGMTRMENTGQIYNAAKTKLLSAGEAPLLVEPLAAKIVLYRFKKDPALRVRALDAGGAVLKTKVSSKWVKEALVVSWVPGVFYLEIYK